MTSERAAGRWRSLREIVILVVGILVAFALDSWWDGRAESSRRAGDLASLRSDFVQNRNQLLELVAHQARVADSSRRLAQLTDGPEPLPDSLPILLGAVYSSRRFEPLLGTYRGVAESGGINRPSDRELRAALASFAAAIELRYMDDFADALYLDLIDDFPDVLGVMLEGKPPGESIPTLGSSLFRTALTLRATAEAEVGRRYSALLDRAERILVLLEDA